MLAEPAAAAEVVEEVTTPTTMTQEEMVHTPDVVNLVEARRKAGAQVVADPEVDPEEVEDHRMTTMIPVMVLTKIRSTPLSATLEET